MKNSKNDEKTIIDSKPYEYSIYSLPDNQLELTVIRHDIGGGIDISYLLTAEETENYFSEGIETLRNRIEQMKKNYSDYKIRSWR